MKSLITLSIIFAIHGLSPAHAYSGPEDESEQHLQVSDEITQQGEQTTNDPATIEPHSENNQESIELDLIAAEPESDEGYEIDAEVEAASKETTPRESYFEYGAYSDNQQDWDDSNDADLYAYDTEIEDQALPEGVILPALPGEDISYKLKVYRSNYHDLHGRADSDIGKLKFKAKLMPNNDVKIEFNVKGEEDALFQAYIDLANYRMELDGGGAVLTQEQKTMMEYTSEHLRQSLIKKFLDEIPVHSVMTMQMLAYWSKSPNGYKHDKREVVEN